MISPLSDDQTMFARFTACGLPMIWQSAVEV